jgi:hypothetical protein
MGVGDCEPTSGACATAISRHIDCVFELIACSRSLGMKKLSVLCVALCVSLSTTAAFARGGGMGLHMAAAGGIPVTGGAFGTSAAAPGTNSLGTALPSSGIGRPTNGPLLGTNPAIDREEARVEKMMSSICRGC